MSLTPHGLHRDPDCLTRRLRAGDGTAFTGRLLRPDDADALGRYFDGLSAATRRVYGPHPLDADWARQLCARIDYGRALRFIATAVGLQGRHPGAHEEVVAYFILELGVRERDGARFAGHGLPLVDAETCTFAPSVADAYQERGLGSALMPLVMEAATRSGRRRVILMGGVRGDNPRARHFYGKFGFRPVGNFAAGGVDNSDMVLDL